MIVLVVLVVLISLGVVFFVLTREEIYDTSQPPYANRKDTAGDWQRPFEVDEQEYPFTSHWFESEGVAMHYIDEGEGIPILLCHGNPDWSFLYRNVIKGLSGEARLIAFDLPGFGYSQAPEGFTFTPQEHVEWICALVFEHLQLDQFIVVGGDWGGPTGLEVATQHPDKVLGAVISNTMGFRSEGPSKIFSRVFRLPMMQRLLRNRNFLANVVLPNMLSEKSRSNKAALQAYSRAFPTPESRRGCAEFPCQITLAGDWLEALEARLHKLADKPIELIFGRKDPLLGTASVIAKWRSHYPDANVQELSDAGHFTQEDSPESFILAVRSILKQIS